MSAETSHGNASTGDLKKDDNRRQVVISHYNGGNSQANLSQMESAQEILNPPSDSAIDYKKMMREYQEMQAKEAALLEQKQQALIEKLSSKNEVSLDLIMNQVEIAMDGYKKDFYQRLASKEDLDSFEYRMNRKLGDVERIVQHSKEDLNLLRNLLNQEIMNIGELRTQVFEINTLVDDHQNQILTLQVDVMQRLPEPGTYVQQFTSDKVAAPLSLENGKSNESVVNLMQLPTQYIEKTITKTDPELNIKMEKIE
jgi:hypothetical protein